MIIYKISNSVNNKVYIGQSINHKKRWMEHKRCARAGKSGNLYRAMRKHGIESFTFEIIDGANSLSELTYKEVHYIHAFDSVKSGYNMVYAALPPQTPKVKIRVICNKTGEINIHEGFASLANLGVCPKSIGSMLNGKRAYKDHNGYRFEYVDRDTIKAPYLKIRRVRRVDKVNGEVKIYSSVHDIAEDGFLVKKIRRFLYKEHVNNTPFHWEFA